jgi:hypothetical protein
MPSAVLLLSYVSLINIDKLSILYISWDNSMNIQTVSNILYLLFLHDPQFLCQPGEPVLVLVPGQLHSLSKQATNISQH